MRSITIAASKAKQDVAGMAAIHRARNIETVPVAALSSSHGLTDKPITVTILGRFADHSIDEVEILKIAIESGNFGLIDEPPLLAPGRQMATEYSDPGIPTRTLAAVGTGFELQDPDLNSAERLSTDGYLYASRIGRVSARAIYPSVKAIG